MSILQIKNINFGQILKIKWIFHSSMLPYSTKFPRFDINKQHSFSIPNNELTKNINTSIDHTLNPKRLDFERLKTQEELTTEEIHNLDIIYKDFKFIKATSKKGKSFRQFHIKFDVNDIFNRKLGDNFLRIVQFLTIRSNKLTETELLYILKTLFMTNTLNRLFIEYPHLQSLIIGQLAIIKCTSYSNSIDFLNILHAQKIWDFESWKNLAKYMAQFIHNPVIQITNEHLLSGIRLLSEDFMSKVCEIMPLIKAINQRFFETLTNFNLAMEYLRLIEKLNLFKIAFDQDKFIHIFSNYHNYVTIQEYIEILTIFIKNGITASYFYAQFILDINKKLRCIDDNPEQSIESAFKTANHQDFSQLCWALSQIPLVIENQNVWIHLEDMYILYLEKTIDQKEFDGISFSRTIQSFNSCNQGSSNFWKFPFNLLTKSCPLHYLQTLDFTDTMTIFYRRLVDIGQFSAELFFKLTAHEEKLKMEYLNDTNPAQFIKTIYCYMVGLDYLYANNETTSQLAEHNVKDLAWNLGSKINSFMADHEREFKTMDGKDFLKLFYIVIYGYENDLIHLKDQTIEILTNEILYKYKKFDTLDLLKLVTFVSKNNNKMKIEEDRIIILLKHKITKCLLVEIFDIINELIRVEHYNKYIWCVLEIKIIEYLDSLSNSDFISVGIMLKHLNAGSDELWQFYEELMKDRLKFMPSYQVNLLKDNFAEDKQMIDVIEKYKVIDSDSDSQDNNYIREETNYLNFTYLQSSFNMIKKTDSMKENLNKYLREVRCT